ncbi:hypothetical protein ABG768_018376, partial [Culter alburnus]
GGLGYRRRTEDCQGLPHTEGCLVCGHGAEGCWTDAAVLRGACTAAAAMRDVWAVALRGTCAVALKWLK